MRTILHVDNNEHGKKIIASLRIQAKAHNLMERAKETLDPSYEAVFKRVDLFGRLGRNNPNRYKYSVVARRRGYRRSLRISMQDAQYIAVYYNNIVRTNYGVRLHLQ
jgi:hypothetical protein